MYKRTAAIFFAFILVLVLDGAAWAQFKDPQEATYPPPVIQPAQTEPPKPVRQGQGADSMLKGPDLRGGHEPTFYERFGADPYMEIDSDLGVGDIVQKVVNGIASIIWSVVVWIAAGAVTLFQWAFSLELVNMVGEAVGGMVRSIRDAIYTPFLQAMIVLAGAWAVWHALVKRRGLLASEGLIWSVALLIVTVFFFSTPEGFVTGANNLSAGVSRAVLEGISVLDPGESAGDSEATFGGDGADNQLRVSADRWWSTYVYVPWSVMEFGDQKLADDYGEDLLWSKTITADEWDRIEGAGGAGGDYAMRLIKEKGDRYEDIKEDLGSKHPQALEWFNGHHPFQRAGIALLALVVVLFAGGLLIVLSGAVLLMQLALILLVVLAPFFLLLGIWPGAGRVVAMRWIETMVGLLVKRVALSALLATILVVGGVLLDATSELGWGIVMAVQVLVLLVALVYRKPFVHIFQAATLPAGVAANRAPSSLERESRERLVESRRSASRWRRSLSHASLAYVGGKVADSNDGTQPPSSQPRRSAKPGLASRLKQTVTPDRPESGGSDAWRPLSQATRGSQRTMEARRRQNPGEGTPAEAWERVRRSRRSSVLGRRRQGSGEFDPRKHGGAPPSSNGNGAGGVKGDQ
jgi:hypothetical protein